MSTPAKRNYLQVLLVGSLFFLWGLSYGLLDVLNKHFQETLHLSKSESSFLQFAYFGAYFIMAIPAARLMSRRGYSLGVLVGLLLFALGALAFFPAVAIGGFVPFLAALFVLACGLAFLETAANPLMTVLGPPESGTFRLNLAQSFNGVGSIVGPLLGILFLGKTGAEGNDSLLSVYLMIATAVITVAFLFRRAELPEPAEESEQSDFKESYWFLINDNRFRISVIAQACYVAAQVGVAAYFINYATEVVSGLSNGHAASYLSGAMLLFTLGRFTGSFLLKFTDAGMLLLSYGAINILLCAFCIYAEGMPALVALMAVFFFESIMFPTIFSLGIRDLGKHRKAGSSLLVMSIVGGALIPFLMGYIADEWSTPIAYSVPLVCFVAVSYFGFYSRQLSKP